MKLYTEVFGSDDACMARGCSARWEYKVRVNGEFLLCLCPKHKDEWYKQQVISREELEKRNETIRSY